MKTWALVPIKESAHAKQRLSFFFTTQLRQALFSAMVTDVLAALAASTSICGFAVVTVDPAAQKLARRCGGLVIEAGARLGHSNAAMSGICELTSRQGADAVLTLPMDVPLITTEDIDSIITAHEKGHRGMTLVPSHDCRGTNATLSSPPGCIELRFGEDSFVAHVKAARSAKIRPSVLSLPNVALDIDRPEDVERLLGIPRNTRTHEALAKAGYRPGAFWRSDLLETRAAQWN